MRNPLATSALVAISLALGFTAGEFTFQHLPASERLGYVLPDTSGGEEPPALGMLRTLLESRDGVTFDALPALRAAADRPLYIAYDRHLSRVGQSVLRAAVYARLVNLGWL